jgi:hypothetical protein
VLVKPLERLMRNGAHNTFLSVDFESVKSA